MKKGGARANPFHTYLRRLASAGRSNMYGAVPYLMEAFTLSRDDAFRIVCEWLDQQAALAAAPPAEPVVAPPRVVGRLAAKPAPPKKKAPARRAKAPETKRGARKTRRAA